MIALSPLYKAMKRVWLWNRMRMRFPLGGYEYALRVASASAPWTPWPDGAGVSLSFRPFV